MDVGTRLKNLRLEEGLSQRDLAELAGCSHQAIATLERNENIERIKLIKRLCNIFNISTDYLISGAYFDINNTLSMEEIQLILRYRSLSDYYKSMIDQIVESGEKAKI